MFCNGRCSHCSYEIAEFAPNSLYLRLDSDVLVPIPYPGEQHHLQQAGYTFREAHAQHRIIQSYGLTCAQCGHLVNKFELQVVPSCLNLLGAFVGMIAMIFFLPDGVPIYWRIGAAFGFALGCPALEVGIMRLHSRKQARQLPLLRACPECSCRRFFSIPGNRPHVCPQCRERSLHFQMTLKT